MQPAVSTPLSFPRTAPVLIDETRRVLVRPHTADDLAALVEQARDPESVRFTTVPTPYGTEDARAFLSQVALGWQHGDRLSWAVEADRGGGRGFCGSVDLRITGVDEAEIGFGLHPAARGRGVMSSAVRLVRDQAFARLGLRVLRWRAVVGNWPSRRVAAAAGFRFEGTVRLLLEHRGERLDGWHATAVAGEPLTDRSWSDPPRLPGRGLVLRPFVDPDATRVAEACADRRTRYWLTSLPSPYTHDEALAYIEATREDAAQHTAHTWCVADATDDRCLGAISLDGFGGYHRRSEIGYWAHPQARGRGLMSEAVRVLTRYAEEQLAVHSLLVRCAARNGASRQVATRNGYREVGVLTRAEPLGDGTLDDLVLYARP